MSDSRAASVALLAGVALTVLPELVRAQTTVDTCGQVVSGAGVLAADLDCTGFAADALTLKPGASLDLAGFTLTGGTGDGVVCESSCRVFSSAATKGTIRNAGRDGIKTRELQDSEHTITVSNMIVTGNGESGVVAGFCCFTGTAVVLDSSVTDNVGGGVVAIRRANVQRSDVSGNGSGVSACFVSIQDSTADGNDADGVYSCGYGFRAINTRANGNGEFGFYVGRDAGGIKFKDCEASGNVLDGVHFDRIENGGPKLIGGTFNANGRDGIRFDDQRFMIDVRAKVVGADVSGNAANGIYIGTSDPLDVLTLRRVTASGNGGAGVTGSYSDRGLNVSASTITSNGTFGIETLPPVSSTACPVRLRSSTLTGNGTGVDCGVTITCADVGSCEAPSLASTVQCDTSYDTSSGFPGTSWSVCAAD